MITNDKILDNLVKLIDSDDIKNMNLANVILKKNNITLDEFYRKKINHINIGDLFYDGGNVYKVIEIIFHTYRISFRGKIISNMSIGKSNLFLYKYSDKLSKATKENIDYYIKHGYDTVVKNDIYEMLPDK